MKGMSTINETLNETGFIDLINSPGVRFKTYLTNMSNQENLLNAFNEAQNQSTQRSKAPSVDSNNPTNDLSTSS